jgi:hypothetical protein
MHVQVVQHDPAHLDVGRDHVHQPLQPVRHIARGAASGGLDVPPAGQRLDSGEPSAGAVAAGLGVEAAQAARLGGEWRARLGHEWQRPLVEADDGTV